MLLVFNMLHIPYQLAAEQCPNSEGPTLDAEAAWIYVSPKWGSFEDKIMEIEFGDASVMICGMMLIVSCKLDDLGTFHTICTVTALGFQWKASNMLRFSVGGPSRCQTGRFVQQHSKSSCQCLSTGDLRRYMWANSIGPRSGNIKWHPRMRWVIVVLFFSFWSGFIGFWQFDFPPFPTKKIPKVCGVRADLIALCWSTPFQSGRFFFGSIATKTRHNKNVPETKTPSLKTRRSKCSHWNIGFSPAAILYDFVRSIVCGNAYGLILEHQFCQCNLCSALDLNLDWWIYLQLDWNLRSLLHSKFTVSLFCKRFYLMFFFHAMLSNPVSVWHFWFISMVWFVNFARFSSSAVALEEIFQVKQKCHKIQSTFGMPGITRIQCVILNIFQFQRILNVRMCALFVHPCPAHPLEPWHSPSRAGHDMSRYVKMCPICRICMDMLRCCWLMWGLNWLSGDTSFEIYWILSMPDSFVKLLGCTDFDVWSLRTWTACACCISWPVSRWSRECSFFALCTNMSPWLTVLGLGEERILSGQT